MKVQVILLMAFVAICTSDKEEMGDLAELLNDPQFSEKLLLALEKRLSSPARPKTQDAAKRPTGDCKFATNDSTIIKTQDSIDNGAHFIAAPHLGKDACIRKCCDDGNCTVAVLKENDLACYLFNCGSPNKCLFSSHPDFSVWSLTGSHSTVPVATRKEQENHANALKNLATTKKPTPAPTQNPAALFGACSEAKDCMGSFTDCIVKMCLCQKGYHEQDGMCKPKDQKLPTKETSEPSTTEDSKPAAEQTDMNKEEQKEKATDPEAKPIDNHTKPKSTPDKENPDNSENTEGSTDDNSKDKEVGLDNKEEKLENKENESNEKTEVNPSDKEPVETTDGTNDVKSKKDKEMTDDNKNTINDVSHLGNSELVHKLDTRIMDSNSLEEEPTIKKNKPVKSQGAIIALALGLAITALLLVFVGCRLRNVKHRLRRGRPMQTNEADYLINGMYL